MEGGYLQIVTRLEYITVGWDLYPDRKLWPTGTIVFRLVFEGLAL